MKSTSKKQNNISKILDLLDKLYPNPQAPLNHSDPYTLLIAVLLSAQCTDLRVNQITPALFKLADTPQKMLKTSVDEIYEIIRPCGLAPRKSKAIWELSKILVEKHEGKVPPDIDLLEALPGVGHKTASVVVTQAFGKAAFPVDTHIHRLATRWGLTSGKSVTQTERDLKSAVPKEQWGKVHLQMIFFGRQHCPARGHNAKSCPVCSWV